jgi:hypothetical protein
MIRLILGLQLGMAALLFAGDLARGWTGPGLAPGFGPEAPSLRQPVRPGDQTRRFAPGDWPAGPGTPMPEGGELPDRLSLVPFTESGQRVLLLEGMIAPGDAQRMATALERDAVEVARLNSPGGSVQDALAIGRQLRAAGIAAEVGPGAICLSACPYMLAGGATRRVSDEAAVGVHQHYFGENTVLPAFLAVEDIQRGQGEVMAYLDEMGIDLRLMQPALATPPDEIYILVRDELEDYRLIGEAGAEAG